jgi:hypothetical protein
MRRVFCATLLLAGGVMLIAQADRPESRMARAAAALLATLHPDQAAKIRWPFDSDERFNWHFVPRERQGLSLKAMTQAQRDAAIDLLRAGLSAKGYSKAETIRSLEIVLHALEGTARRDPDQYYFTIFGEPGSDRWGWRYEGHHISQNWTVVNGNALATTPQFFGANPAEVREGPQKGTRALAVEEDLAYELLRSLDETQRKTAIIDPKAPNDVLTTNSREAAIQEDRGLAYAQMNASQKALLMKLVEANAAAQPDAVARERVAKLKAAGLDKIKFAWMGALEPGQGHYYRVQGPTFLIEFDNTQNNANHIHLVWRDFKGDWGRDLLAEHYKTSQHGQ